MSCMRKKKGINDQFFKIWSEIPISFKKQLPKNIACEMQT